MTCRDEILVCVENLIKKTGSNKFFLEDVIKCMMENGTQYQESTIRTHVSSRMCRNAPQHHQVKYEDLERIGHGKYQLIQN